MNKKMECKCQTCGKSFLKKPYSIKKSKTHYCSTKCRNARKRIELKCVCGKLFLRTSSQIKVCKNRYCSSACYSKIRVTRKEIKCQTCGKSYLIIPYRYKMHYRLKKYKNHYCSSACYGKSRMVTTKEIKCQTCGKSFLKRPCRIKRSKNHYCSTKCRPIRKKLKCGICGKSFLRIPHNIKRSKNNYCSHTCHSKSRIIRKKLKCRVCGNSFLIAPYWVNKSKNHYCSSACHGKSRMVTRKELKCKICGASFSRTPSQIKKSKNHYCSYKCIRIDRIFPKKDTSIEVKIQNFLKELGIEFYTHQYMKIENGYQCDILIPTQKEITQPIIIECDGDFFHCNPKFYSADYVRFPKDNDKRKAKDVWERDYLRTAELESKGYIVLRLWEDEIRKMKLDNFKNIVYPIYIGNKNG
ncbi:MAG TPA: DUF559 domain-containing protein [bacterium]|nr:DUF559 domain-containing protein [bacterium]